MAMILTMKVKGRKKVKINFYPFRKNMLDEIEQCAALNKVDNLLSFCKSCVFMTVSKRVEPECSSCVIHEGISSILRRTKIDKIADEVPFGIYYEKTLQ